MVNKSDVANILKISLTTLSSYAQRYNVWEKGDTRKKITRTEAQNLLRILGSGDEVLA